MSDEKIVLNGVEYVRADQVVAVPLQKIEHPLTVGNAVFVRTVTGYYTGLLAEITNTDLLLTDAAWIADTGRWNNALVTGQLEDIEPYPDPTSVSRGSVVDVTTWKHPLPRTVK